MADLQAQWETELRKKLAAIRDEAMELAVMIEFTGITNAEFNPIHQFAIATINRAESIASNQLGELDYPTF